MKKGIRRLISLGLMLSLFSITACAKSNSGDSKKVVAPAAKEVVLKLGIWPEDTLTEDIKMHEKWTTDFKAKNPGIKVVPANYKYATDTFISLAESGNLPTVFET